MFEQKKIKMVKSKGIFQKKKKTAKMFRLLLFFRHYYRNGFSFPLLCLLRYFRSPGYLLPAHGFSSKLRGWLVRESLDLQLLSTSSEVKRSQQNKIKLQEWHLVETLCKPSHHLLRYLGSRLFRNGNILSHNYLQSSNSTFLLIFNHPTLNFYSI